MNEIGPNVAARSELTTGVVLATWGGRIELDERVFLGPYTVIYGQGGVTIGKNTMIASHTSIAAVNHIFADPRKPIYEQGLTTVGIHIGEDVWIGTGVRILDGVTIGKGSVIGAGSVVTKSIPEYSVAVGVPARVVRTRG